MTTGSRWMLQVNNSNNTPYSNLQLRDARSADIEVEIISELIAN